MMRSTKRTGNGDTSIAAPQDWTSFQPGDLIEVIEPGGYTYVARIETKTEQSDIIWIRSYGMGTRHLLHNLDGTRLQAKTPAEQPRTP
ncbi:hypothetical protein [Arthrobacter sp. ISL-65]|uniref:hypothetical protein n=1 Tax=Arthrobacter sp. ISL-65 TaxID=2819112 RepID=UPI001BE6D08B|nr:hypothetical protein [Arthrobacter sp. ISL-65]MBT2550553.1 hypothetical protein [Arthrobacter sp. ISL-65]